MNTLDALATLCDDIPTQLTIKPGDILVWENAQPYKYRMSLALAQVTIDAVPGDLDAACKIPAITCVVFVDGHGHINSPASGVLYSEDYYKVESAEGIMNNIILQASLGRALSGAEENFLLFLKDTSVPLAVRQCLGKFKSSYEVIAFQARCACMGI